MYIHLWLDLTTKVMYPTTRVLEPSTCVGPHNEGVEKGDALPLMGIANYLLTGIPFVLHICFCYVFQNLSPTIDLNAQHPVAQFDQYM